MRHPVLLSFCDLSSSLRLSFLISLVIIFLIVLLPLTALPVAPFTSAHLGIWAQFLG
jgi:hypothetical protein